MIIKELNKRKKYTGEQLKRLKKFQDKFLNVSLCHFDYWVDGKGYETVYEVRGISGKIRENYETVDEVLTR